MERVVNYILNHGTKEEPITNKEISSALKISEVNVRKYINQARRESIPICSCTEGYFYSEDKTDILETIDSLMHRTMAVEKAVTGLLTTLRWEDKTDA